MRGRGVRWVALGASLAGCSLGSVNFYPTDGRSDGRPDASVSDRPDVGADRADTRGGDQDASGGLDGSDSEILRDVVADVRDASTDAENDVSSDAQDDSADVSAVADAPADADARADSASPMDVPEDGDALDVATDALRCTDSGCDIPPPRPIAPMSTSQVTSQTPELRCQLPPGVEEARVEIARDRGFTTMVQTIDVVGSTTRPGIALTAGVWFWRVRSKIGSSIGAAASPTWQFRVAIRSAPVDGIVGHEPDVNGDGYTDVIVSAWGAMGGSGRVHIYLGSPAGITANPMPSLNAREGATTNFGSGVSSAGDVNGDGYADVIVGAQGARSLSGRAYLYLGGAGGLAQDPLVEFPSPDGPNAWFGHAVAGIGDVNGDGYGDIAVGAWGALGFMGRVHVYLGASTGPDDIPDVSLASPAVADAGVEDGGTSQNRFGYSVAGAGDVNADGFADLLVGEPNADLMGPTGRVHLFLGGMGGVGRSPELTLAGPDDSSRDFGHVVAAAGDVNGDGYADTAVGEPNTDSATGRIHLYRGSSAGLVSTPQTTVTGPAGIGGDFGSAVARAGDVNNDGYGDLVVAAPGAMSGAGIVYVFGGAASGLSGTSMPALMPPGGISGTGFGRSIASADVDGDAFSDVVVGAPFAMSTNGRVYVFKSGASGLEASPSGALNGVDGTSSRFGDPVSGLR